MVNLKDLKNKISGVKKTKRIINAMKMVAVSKLKSAKEAVIHMRDYSEALSDTTKLFISQLRVIDIEKIENKSLLPMLFYKYRQEYYCSFMPKDTIKLLVIIGTDKGLCGAINYNLIKIVKSEILLAKRKGIIIKIFCIGKKTYSALREEFGEDIIYNMEGCSGGVSEEYSRHIASKILDYDKLNMIYECKLFYTEFINSLEQRPKEEAIIPLPLAKVSIEQDKNDVGNEIAYCNKAILEITTESLDVFLKNLILQNIFIKIHEAFLNVFASEQAAKMNAMDSSSKNCTEVIERDELQYSKMRQAKITKELIEIIAGVESLS